MVNNPECLVKIKTGSEKQVEEIGEKSRDGERLREDSQDFPSADVLVFWWVKLFGLYWPRVHLSHNYY